MRLGNPFNENAYKKYGMELWVIVVFSKLIESGLVMLDNHPFNEKLFCQGNGPRFQDFHNYALNPNEGFWFVAQITY
jgi:hypothetical protein